MTFKIGDIDYSKKLISPYKVNQYKEYDEFIDGNGNKHKRPIRIYISGTAKIKLTKTEYDEFLKTLEKNTYDELCAMTVTVNNTKIEKSSNFYLQFFPEIIKDTSTNTIYNIIELELEEF